MDGDTRWSSYDAFLRYLKGQHCQDNLLSGQSWTRPKQDSREQIHWSLRFHPSTLHLVVNFTRLFPRSRSLSGGSAQYGYLYLYFEVFVDFYLQSWHRLKKLDTTFQHFDFEWTERREWRNEELFTFYSTRASLLLFTNITSVTPGLNRSEFTITVNARWQIGRRTSDQMDHSVCALRWQVWWLHCGLSIKISSGIYGFPEKGRKQDKTQTQRLIDPPLPIKCLNY